ncbi:MAG: glucosamine-6-phosphate deaminase [Pirellulaceae bacterium]|nr:glucosamine-6-phosphate deaminase [Pirellulaceae bacterium]MDP6556271.1 glucosamine-6-phosphate deaminase [Pirellulaceae bacterium]
MRVIVEKTADKAELRAASLVADLVRRKPQAALGLATGSTPINVYRELIRIHRDSDLDFSQITTFNLDEYVGLGPKHPQSFRYFMQEQLFDHINIDLANTFVPDGRALDFESHCRQFEQRIVDVGGIDLQLLGIGVDGHIAFNEPGSSLGSRTRLKTLASETIRQNAKHFPGDQQVPRLALTMGVGTILESRKCLLLATGSHKASAIRSMIEGPVTAQITASALQLHREVIVIVDEQAGGWLERRDYYSEVEECHQLLESGQLRALGIGNQ